MHTYTRHILIGVLLGANIALGMLITHAITTGEAGIPGAGIYQDIFTKILVDPTPSTDGKVKNTKELGGIPAALYQRNITGQCTGGSLAVGVNPDNTIKCQ